MSRHPHARQSATSVAQRQARTVRRSSSASPILGVGVLCGALALVIGSMMSLTTALPSIGASTGATQSDLTWIIDSYTVAFAGLLLPAGALGDKYGRRRMLINGLLIFAVACVVGAVLATPSALIATRIVAGVGAALVMPATLSLITTTVREDLRDQAAGLWAAVATIGGALGIVFAGLVLQSFDWQVILHVSAGVAAVLALCCRVIPESSEPDQPRFDVPGAVTSSAAIALVVFGIAEAPSHGWGSLTVTGCLVAGAVFAVAFVAVELHRSDPLLDVRIFRARPVLTGTLTLGILFAVLFGFLFVSMQYLQLVQGRSALQAGLAIVPMALTILPLAVFAPNLVARAGERTVATLGLVLLAISLAVMADLGTDGHSRFLVGVLLLGASIGLCVTPATTSILNSLPSNKRGVGSAINDAAREVGAALGIASLGTLLATGYRDHLGPASAALPEPARTQTTNSLAGALEATGRMGDPGLPALTDAREAFLAGMQTSFHFCALITAITAVGVLVCAPGRDRRARDDHRELDPARLREAAARGL